MNGPKQCTYESKQRSYLWWKIGRLGNVAPDLSDIVLDIHPDRSLHLLVIFLYDHQVMVDELCELHWRTEKIQDECMRTLLRTFSF